ncbi:polysaccharide deacetylase family protein [Chelatococcus sp. YT9]|uniref:polysaccharide deacetylase family protein n=1 Tax=Chelatococcus sp. YT9 TaxID=2835635 RepID=UPI001BCE9456|nr:polysaccharide deacetylase family protein [Chelatococcus sp. YT9]MBS7698840.1 polysaccharide deacetylase family protein [Chelatococcus sp. YT9]
MSIRYSVLRMGFAMIAATQANRWLGPFARGRGLILTLHHVRPRVPRDFAPNAILEITPDFLDQALHTLARSHDFVALGDIPQRLREPDGRPFVAVTFDDGYRDNAEFALPVLQRHGVPWTLFVTPGFADRSAQLWWLELEEAIRRLDHLEVEVGGSEPLSLSLPARSATEKATAFDQLYWQLRAGTEERLRAVVAELAQRTGVDGIEMVERLCLDWDGLRALSGKAGVSIGAHTMTHPMLAKHSRETARAEMYQSRETIERELGIDVRHFAYPVGDRGSAGPREFDMAAEAGFEVAVTTRPGHIFAEHAGHLQALPRVSLNGAFQTGAAVQALASGVPFLLWNRGRHLNVN